MRSIEEIAGEGGERGGVELLLVVCAVGEPDHVTLWEAGIATTLFGMDSPGVQYRPRQQAYRNLSVIAEHEEVTRLARVVAAPRWRNDQELTDLNHGRGGGAVTGGVTHIRSLSWI